MNVFVYLNEDWDSDLFNGDLELWDAGMTKKVVSLPPLLNNMVVFTVSDKSFHGHPDVLTCGENNSRKSIAYYYYTVNNEQNIPVQDTNWQRRPNEL